MEHIVEESVVDFYKNKNVLLTGATGFFGKMIIEKLLRVCDVGTIYVMIRAKKDVKPSKRIETIFKEPLFDRIRNKLSILSDKICVIQGDLRQERLGISEYDKKILQDNVHIILHCGASLNMGASLQELTLTNIRGTWNLLEIFRNSKQLQAMVLISTAYSWCINNRIEEKSYKLPVNPLLLIKLAQELDKDVMEKISKGITGKWPNCYAFTKAVSENLLLEQHMPVAILRPTIVTSSVSEPMPGWTDNLYGPLGILYAQHCGIQRILAGDTKVRADTVPVDLAVNAVLCLAWNAHKEWCKNNQNYKAPILNFSGNRSKLYLPMRKYVDSAHEMAPPFERAVWFPILFIVKNKILYAIMKFFLQSVPAILIDFVSIITGGKASMWKTYTRLDKVSAVLRYFLVTEWHIDDTNVTNLWSSLSENDRKLFPFDVAEVDHSSYLKDMMTGLKLYVAKEDVKDIKEHMVKYQRLQLLHNTIKYIAWFIICYSLLRRSWYFFIKILLKF